VKVIPVWRRVLGFFLWEDPPRGGRSYRPSRGWYLRLECGHEESRHATYRRTRPGVVQTREREDVKPPPRRVRCGACEHPGGRFGDAFTEIEPYPEWS
jgi:hypothetical protein